MNEAGGERPFLPAVLPPVLLLPILLLVTFPRWPYYEDARLALLGASAPLPALLWALAVVKGKARLPQAGAWTGLGLWTAGILLSFLGPGPLGEKILGTAWLMALFFLLLASSALDPGRHAPWILLSWALAGAAAALAGILQAAGWDPLGVAVPWEPGSFLGNRNAASEVCVVLAPGLAGLVLLPGAGRSLRRVAGVSLFLLLLYAGITRTRAGVPALAAGLGGAILLPWSHGGGRFRRRAALLFLGACLAWVGGLLASPRPTGKGGLREQGPPSRAARPARKGAERSSPRVPSTWKVRLLLWKSTARMALARPLTGWGAGSFEREFPAWRDPREIRVSSMDHAFETRVNRAHSDPLQVFAETGALGLAGYLVLLLGGIAAGRRKAGKDPLAAGLLGTCLAFLVNGLFRSPLYNAPAAAAAFTALGLLWASPPPEDPPRRGPLPAVAAILPFLLLLYPAWRSLEAFRAHCLLAKALGEKDRKDFLSDTEAALEADPESPLALQILARDLLERGTPAEKARLPLLLRKALRARPYDVLNLRSRAELLFDTARAMVETRPKKAAGILLAAKKDLERALALDPENPSTLALSGRVAEALGDVPGALEAWKKVARKYPKALLERSKALEKEGREEMSCLFLQAWLEDHPGRAEYWRSLAKRWRKLGFHTRADYCQGRAHRIWAVEALKNGDLRLAALHTRLYAARSDQNDPGPVLLKAIIALLEKKPGEAAALARTLPRPGEPLAPSDLQDLRPWVPLLRKNGKWAPLLPRAEEAPGR